MPVASRSGALKTFATRLDELRSDPIAFCREILGIEPHPGQQKWLEHSNADQNALVTGNRWGKSEIAAAKRLWKCTYKIGWDGARAEAQKAKRSVYQSLNVAPTADQAALVFHKAYAMLQNPKASWLVRDVKMTPFPTITFVNGAVFQARSTAGDGRHLLGHDYDDVNWDESAYEPRFAQILENVLLMRLVDRAGKLDCTSTGNGRNTFGEYFLGGLPGASARPGVAKIRADYSQSGSTRENPHVDQARVQALSLRLTDKMRAQNIDGQIVEGGGSYFEIADLEAAEDRQLNEFLIVEYDDEAQHSYAEVRPDQSHTWIEAYPNHRYLHGWDIAEKQDWAVGWTLDLSTDPYTCVEFERFRRRGWDYVYARMRRRDRKYGTPRQTRFDSTGVGDTLETELADISAEGVSFGGRAKKDAILANLQSAFSTRSFRMPFLPVVHNEVAFYEREDEDLVTDCVMGLAVAMWFAKRTPDVFDEISLV